jgi:hypothetical protein
MIGAIASHHFRQIMAGRKYRAFCRQNDHPNPAIQIQPFQTIQNVARHFQRKRVSVRRAIQRYGRDSVFDL